VAELSADAVDQEDGALPGSAITWTVRRRHANHSHPHLGPVSGRSVTTRYPAPEELAATRNSYLVVRAIATDSRGIRTGAKQFLLPRKVRLTFDASPRGAEVTVQGVRRRTPVTVVSWAGYVFPVAAPDQRFRGADYVFRRWSDGGARRHEITSPRRPETYVARFRKQ
jgi:hypothetical protein